MRWRIRLGELAEGYTPLSPSPVWLQAGDAGQGTWGPPYSHIANKWNENLGSFRGRVWRRWSLAVAVLLVASGILL